MLNILLKILPILLSINFIRVSQAQKHMWLFCHNLATILLEYLDY